MFSNPWILSSIRLFSLFGLFVTTHSVASNTTYAQDPSADIVVAWNDGLSGQAKLQSFTNVSPWSAASPLISIGRHSIMRYHGGLLYVVSKQDATVTVIDPNTWEILRTLSVGTGLEPVDIAIVTPELAYVSCVNETHLLRFNPATGDTQAVVDLSVFADADGIPEMNMMAVHENHLFIQIQRFDPITQQFILPAMLAVMDVTTESLIDVDDVTGGIQAIELQGTAPKFKMQIVDETRRLFLSASGDFFDEGGLEMIDLDTLQSLGFVEAEVDSQVGADLGAFVLVTPERGYLAFSTDLATSSHLISFTVDSGADPSVGLDETVGYFSPTMVFDASNDTLLFPVGGFNPPGVHILNANTGQFIKDLVVTENAWVTDVVLIPAGVPSPVPTVTLWGLFIFTLMIVIAGSIVVQRRIL